MVREDVEEERASESPEQGEDGPSTGASVQLSQTFQAEVARASVPPPSVQLSRTFQSELARVSEPPPVARIPPPRVTARPSERRPPSLEVAKAERLARRLRRASPPGALDVRSRRATVEGMPAPDLSSDGREPRSAPSSERLVIPPPRGPRTTDETPAPDLSGFAPLPGAGSTAPPAGRRAPAPTVEGPPPSMDELAEAASALDRGTQRPPPGEAATTDPTLASPAPPPSAATPTSTPRSPARPDPATLALDGPTERPPPPAPGPGSGPSTSWPPFSTDLLESDVGPLPAGYAELSQTFRSEAQVASDAAAADAGSHRSGTYVAAPWGAGTSASGSATADASASGARPVPAEDEDAPELSVEAARSAVDSLGGPDEEEGPFGDLATGTELGGRYRLERVIGRGATGVVFEASHLVIGKRVALKCLYPRYREIPNAVERFFREARIAATVEHPNVVQVFDGGDDAETMFLAMELLRGETLGDRLDRGPFAADEALELFLKVVDGVAAVHARGVVHRDLKPDNVFLPEPKGGRPLEPKVLDFGVSKLKEPGDKELTSLGTVLGTPYYMAPEQIRSTRDVDVRADVYSLGVILYEMIAGELPYEGDSVVDIFEAARLGEFVPLDRRCAGLPRGLSEVVSRALAAAPEERYEGARALYAALEAVAAAATDPERAPPEPARPSKATLEQPFDPSRLDPSQAPTPPAAPRTASREEAATVELARADAERAIAERAVAERAIAERAAAERATGGLAVAGQAVAGPSIAERASASAPAPTPTDLAPEPRPASRRVWLWIALALLTLVASGVIGAAAIELLR